MIFAALLFLYAVGGAGICFFWALWLKRRFSNGWIVLGGFVIALALVFGGELYGVLSWQYACKTKAGVFVYNVEPVEGFYYSNGGVIDKVARQFLQQGYLYVEGRDSKDFEGGNKYRFYLGRDGEVHRTAIEGPSAKYIFKREDVSMRDFIWGYEYSVANTASGEVNSIYREFGYRGWAVVAFLRKLAGADSEGSADYCGAEGSPNDVIRQGIPPKVQGDK